MSYNIYLADCFDWLKNQKDNSFHSIITDPPFGVKEYTQEELEKKKNGTGGVWRIPPTIGGSIRAPLPRFTDLTINEINDIYNFFFNWGQLINRVLVPGGHVFVASNSLLAPLVFSAIAKGGLEPRGQIIRLVRTFRGGDRPKGSEEEFSQVSTMPRSCHEPWGIFRKRIEGTVAENLRKWKTGGIRRLSEESPYPDVIESGITPEKEKKIAPHPSLKPQEFMRTIVKMSLPLGEGIILDPFMGGGSTIAAAENVGYNSVGLEISEEYFKLAETTIPILSNLYNQTLNLFEPTFLVN